MSSSAFPCSGEMVPQFTLQGQDDRTVRVSDFRGKKNLVLIFAAGQKVPLVRELAGRVEEVKDENTVVLVINSCPESLRAANSLSASIHGWNDPGARMSRRFGAEFEPAVYVTDQYGEIYSAHRSSEGALLPDADDVLASVRHINAACPE